MTYHVRRAHRWPDLRLQFNQQEQLLWHEREWGDGEIAEINNFRPESSSHRPRTQARLLYADQGLYGAFRIEDQYVRCVRNQYLSEVWKDSCVEFFVQPRPDGGYFNLEMNAGGSHLIWYVEDATRSAAGLKKWTPLPPELGQQIEIRSTLPKVVDPEIDTPITWELNFFLPFKVIAKYVGCLHPSAGEQWRGNFFKCAEDLSHPHWASWSPVDEFNFHLPRCFGTLLFE
jgi:hypothetical protein